MSEPRRIRITHIHKEDGFFRRKEKYVGLTGMFKPDPPSLQSPNRPGYFSGFFWPDNQGADEKWYLLGIRYRKEN